MLTKAKLYVVASPIGNMEDISLRALKTLKEVDIIACEDTRRSSVLLRHFDIKKPLISYHKFNEKKRSDYIISELLSGKSAALISDAGCPTISDPGYIVVKEAIDNGIEVSAIPGACAFLTAVMISGWDMGSFTFKGFLPSKKNKRIEEMRKYKDREEALIFYEAPHRLKDFIEDALDVFGDRNCMLARELTKIYEESISMKLSKFVRYYEDKEPRGEYVIIIEGDKSEEEYIDKEKLAKELKAAGISHKDAVKELMKHNISKNEAYKILLEVQRRA